MDIPYVRGKVATQAHVGVPEGTVEEEYARNGFFGRYAHLYRTHPPVGWTRIEGPLRPRAYDPTREARAMDWLEARTPIFENDDVSLGFATLESPMPYLLRNADGDELLFIHAGAGRWETDFGTLPYETGDYLLVPRGTAYRLVPSSSTQALVILAASEMQVPDRGMLGQHALFDPSVVKVPSPDEPGTLQANEQGEWELRVIREGEVTRVFYPFSPHDVVGWKGTLAPMQINVRDIRPVMSERYHLPPSAHSTFVMHNAVVCTFLPRGLETGDPRALKVPFYHSNIDFDEVLFYHRGEFFSRAGISQGMLTFHPQGIHHGPQRQAEARTQARTRTEEIAVMLDTKRPLRPTAYAQSMEQTSYWKSWQETAR